MWVGSTPNPPSTGVPSSLLAALIVLLLSGYAPCPRMKPLKSRLIDSLVEEEDVFMKKKVDDERKDLFR